MMDIKEKIHKAFDTKDVKDMVVEGAKAIIPVQSEIVDEAQSDSKQGCSNIDKSKTKGTYITSHTEADVNWATIINRINIPNFSKGAITLGGGGAGATLGAGLGTGLGFAIGGVPGAVIGYKTCAVLGLAFGIVGGHKLGKVVANEIEDKDQEDIVEKMITKINVDTVTKKLDVKERRNEDEFF